MMHPPTPESSARAGSGKLEPADLERLVLGRLGASRDEVLYGPGTGRDAAVVRVGAGRVLAITTDPLSLIPALGPERSARLAVHLVASDLWTTGIPPAWATISLDLPPSLEDLMLERYLEALHQEWKALGVAVVAGHTGRYPGSALSIVGAATLIGIGDEGRWVGAPFIRADDRLIVTRGCAIETTAIAAHMFPRRFERHLIELAGPGEDVPAALARARALIDRVSVVEDCRTAIQCGVRDQGVSALHDATEGGVLGGLAELARAAQCDLRVERERIPLSLEARAACAAFEIDPYTALSEGTLLVAVRPEHADRVRSAFVASEIEAAEVGEFVRGPGIVWWAEPEGRATRIETAPPDPYWPAYERAIREGWE
jgi:hydrogenase expression/formation protein HypE